MGLVSAGVLLYRSGEDSLEFFLAHPGGPYFAHRDAGVWTIPKGAPLAGETLLEAARREFEEEIGFRVEGALLELGSIRQRSGKIVHAWASAAPLPRDFKLTSNTFELEWPPNSGRKQAFPEVDRAHFFPAETALAKILPAQRPLLERLSALLVQS